MRVPRQCAILVGGLGTRLGELTAETPKPLLLCGDRPFLAWVVPELVRFGIESIVLLAGFRSEQIDQFSREVLSFIHGDLDVTVSVEPERAGTGGALWHAQELLDDSFLCINGDSWIDTDLARFLRLPIQVPNAQGCILLREVADASRYGTVSLDGDRVTEFHEKLEGGGPGVINSGVYIFDKNILLLAKPSCSLERDVLPALARTNSLYGQIFSGFFIDIGIPSDYARAGRELPKRLGRR